MTVCVVFKSTLYVCINYIPNFVIIIVLCDFVLVFDKIINFTYKYVYHRDRDWKRSRAPV